MTIAFVFPGQGSQQIGMMDGFADYPVVRSTFAEASEVLGEDLWRLVTEGPADALGMTRNTQPLMLAAGVAVWRAWRVAGGTIPAYMAGHSLGEYSALVAAGAVAFADAVPLVRFRAQAMQEAVPAGAGAMAAVIGADEAAITEACREAAQGEVVEPVNFNAPGQIVIAGQPDRRRAGDGGGEGARREAGAAAARIGTLSQFIAGSRRRATRVAARARRYRVARDSGHPQRRRRRTCGARRHS